MKTAKRVWEKFISIDNIEEAVYNACRSHKDKGEVARAKKDTHALATKIHDLLVSGKFEFQIPKPRIITERGKRRVIVKPKFFYDHIVHHAIIQALHDRVLDRMHPCSCGSIPGRGTSYVIRRIYRFMHKAKPKYYLQIDIHHFFDSITPEVVMKALSKRVKDHRMLNFIEKLLHTYKGLPLGYYTSQWFANLLLTDLDHAISANPNAKHYTRYMDDIVVMGRNKKKLFKLQKDIQARLHDLKLEMKPNWVVHLFCRKNGMALNFLGHRFRGTFKKTWATLRHSLFLRLRRKYVRLEKKLKDKPVSLKEASAAISYHGWLQTSSTRTFLDKLGKFVKFINDLKSIVSTKRRKK